MDSFEDGMEDSDSDTMRLLDETPGEANAVSHDTAVTCLLASPTRGSDSQQPSDHAILILQEMVQSLEKKNMELTERAYQLERENAALKTRTQEGHLDDHPNKKKKVREWNFFRAQCVVAL